MVGKAQRSHGVRSELNSVFGLDKVDRWNPIRTSAIQSISRPMQFLGFSNHEKGAPRQERNFEVINGLQHVFEKWVERCKKCIACLRPSLHLHEVPTGSNNVSSRTFQTALVCVCVCVLPNIGFSMKGVSMSLKCRLGGVTILVGKVLRRNSRERQGKR
jgi:hypothetical protein